MLRHTDEVLTNDGFFLMALTRNSFCVSLSSRRNPMRPATGPDLARIRQEAQECVEKLRSRRNCSVFACFWPPSIERPQRQASGSWKKL